MGISQSILSKVKDVKENGYRLCSIVNSQAFITSNYYILVSPLNVIAHIPMANRNGEIDLIDISSRSRLLSPLINVSERLVAWEER